MTGNAAGMHASAGLQTEADAYRFLEQVRWGGDGPTRCPHCRSTKGAWFLQPKDPGGRKSKGGSSARSQRRVWKCRENRCRRQFSVLTNTAMHATKMPVRAWIGTIYDLCAEPNGVSAREIAARWEITEKSAWTMLERVRDAVERADLSWLEVAPASQVSSQRSAVPSVDPLPESVIDLSTATDTTAPDTTDSPPKARAPKRAAKPRDGRQAESADSPDSASKEAAAARVRSDVNRLLTEVFNEPVADPVSDTATATDVAVDTTAKPADLPVENPVEAADATDVERPRAGAEEPIAADKRGPSPSKSNVRDQVPDRSDAEASEPIDALGGGWLEPGDAPASDDEHNGPISVSRHQAQIAGIDPELAPKLRRKKRAKPAVAAELGPAWSSTDADAAPAENQQGVLAFETSASDAVAAEEEAT